MLHASADLCSPVYSVTAGLGDEQEVAAAEAKKASLELRVEVVGEERKKLEGQLVSLQGGVAESEAELAQAQEAIGAIKDQVGLPDSTRT